MGLSYFWSYLYYLTEARSEYYVHSPFVYALMSDCLRKKRRLVPESRDRLFERVRDYLEARDSAAEIHRILPRQPIADAFRRLPCSENTAVFIDVPHRDRRREAQWTALCEDPEVALTIDLLRAALVFPRRAMDKEHFCLRYF